MPLTAGAGVHVVAEEQAVPVQEALQAVAVEQLVVQLRVESATQNVLQSTVADVLHEELLLASEVD